MKDIKYYITIAKEEFGIMDGYDLQKWLDIQRKEEEARDKKKRATEHEIRLKEKEMDENERVRYHTYIEDNLIRGKRS